MRTTTKKATATATTRSIPIALLDSREGKAILSKIGAARLARDASVTRTVSGILDDVRQNGDAALLKYTRRFDKAALTKSTLRIPNEHVISRARYAPAALRRSIREAAKRLYRYHSAQGLTQYKISSAEGELRQVVKPLRRVAIYIPGGSAVYPSSVLMGAIPARQAFVPEIVAVTPPHGDLDPGVAYALRHLNITEVYRIGGAQAIAALAYGTQTIPKVDKIVGPGNAYVACAKRLAYGSVDIDTIAGPSEVVIVADKSTPPRLVALDLLAQAEHGTGDEIALCIVESKTVAAKIADAVSKEIRVSPARAVLNKLPRHAIAILVTRSRKESLALVDEIAPEHLQLMTATANTDAWYVNNAAAIFIGVDTPVALGDYFIGTNHVLPTSGTARFASPLGVESFQKRMSMARAFPRGLKTAGEIVPPFARAEGFVHHAMSVEERVLEAASRKRRRT